LSCIILQGSDNTRFYQLKINLANSMTMKQDKFPKTMVETQGILNDYKTTPRQQRAKNPGSNGVAFIQNRPPCKARMAADIDCWHCQKKGHYKSNCPKLKAQELDVGVQNLNIDICNKAQSLFSANKGLTMLQEEKEEKSGVCGILSKHHVYINMCASYASTPYPKILENLRKQACGLVRHSNAGSCGMDTTGETGAVKQMWLNEGRVATIIPLKVLEKIWPVRYDSECYGGLFVIHTKQGKIIIKNSSKGMLYLDLRELEAKVALSFVQMAILFIQTVRGNMEGYTQQEVEEARATREAQAKLGHPTDRDFLGMVHSGMITNCQVSPDAVINANRIFGPDLAGVRWRTVRRPLESVTTNHIQIPRVLFEQHQRATLAVDVMFLNGVPFLVSVSRGLNLVTAEYTPSCMAKQLAVGIRRVMDLYLHGGFHEGRVLMDNEFEKLRNLVPILAVNTTAAKKHVLEVKQCIQLIKECGRGILNTLPFKKMPQVILIELTTTSCCG
jgi:hypothetical protein